MTYLAPNSKVLDYEIDIYKGDDLLDSGTIREVAERRGVAPETIKWYLTGAYQRRVALAKTLDHRIMVVRTDIDDEEDL